MNVRRSHVGACLAAVAASLIASGCGDDAPQGESAPTASAGGDVSTTTASSTIASSTTAVPPPTTTGSMATTSSTEPATVTGPSVRIIDFAFVDDVVTVPVGETLAWTNDDAFNHSVVDPAGQFGSDPLAPGAAFSHTFDTPGEYRYICGIHPYMSGTVIAN